MKNRKMKNVLLWIAQGALAALFVFAGGMKLALPAEMLKGPVAFPVGFLKFIGVAEVLGALGLVLPGILRYRRALTPLAATGLVVIMIGATAITAASGSIAPALIPLVVGVLAATIAYARRDTLARA